MSSLDQKVIDSVREILDSLLLGYGFELVDIEYRREGRGWVLRKVRDFERFKGKLLKIKTMKDIQGRRVFIGRLIDFVGNVASVEMDRHVYFIPYDEIERANLELDF